MSSQVRQPAVYILCSRPRGTLYVGVTSHLAARVWQHRNCVVDAFTSKYGIHRLVYYELHTAMYEAITREKLVKRWKRAWKIRLIEEKNPEWRDLSPEISSLKHGYLPSQV